MLITVFVLVALLILIAVLVLGSGLFVIARHCEELVKVINRLIVEVEKLGKE